MNQIDPAAPIVETIELTPLNVKGELVVTDQTAQFAKRAPFLVRHALFLAVVALPVAIAALYFFVIASDRYLSEARFVVRSAASNGAGGVASMIESQGLSRANDETYAVNDYLASRDVVDQLVRNNGLRDILARPEADFINRYPNFFTRDNKQNLFDRYQEMVGVGIDGATGISTIRVVAFRPDDAHAVAAAVLQYAEGLVNRLNERAYDDAENYAQTIVDRERANVAAIEMRLSGFRNAIGSVDPGKEATAGFELIGKMTTELAGLEADLDQQTKVAPSNPGIPSLRQRIRSYQGEIDRQKLRLVGTNRSLASRLADFEKLQLEKDLAARSLGLATVNLANARADAQQQHLYLETIVAPSLSDYTDYPRRFLGMLIVLVVSLSIYSILRTLKSIALEHRA